MSFDRAVIKPAGEALPGVTSLLAMTTRSIDAILSLDTTERPSLH
jgi:hypothetical protein